MAQEVDHPDWVKPGAEVLLYNTGRTGAPANLVRSALQAMEGFDLEPGDRR